MFNLIKKKNIHDIAAELNGREYGNEMDGIDIEFLKEERIVIVFGASDDLTEFMGVIYDEFGTDTVYLDWEGVIYNECTDDCPYYKQIRNRGRSITPVWHDGGNPCWTYETTIPHAKFNIIEEGETYCEGIVFSLNQV